jgi:hypothetical protein
MQGNVKMPCICFTEINFQKQEPVIKIKDGKGQNKDMGVFFGS